MSFAITFFIADLRKSSLGALIQFFIAACRKIIEKNWEVGCLWEVGSWLGSVEIWQSAHTIMKTSEAVSAKRP